MTEDIIRAIEERQTINFFDASRSISREQVEELVSLATRAPSSFNLQNWRFIAVHSAESKAKLREVAWNQAKITDSAVTFVVIGQEADHELTRERLKPAVESGIMPEQVASAWEGGAKSLYHEQPQRAHDEAVRSATFGASTLMLAGQAMGLGASPMSGFDVDGVTELHDLAEGEFVVMLLALGYATEKNWPQKPRRPLVEVLSFR